MATYPRTEAQVNELARVRDHLVEVKAQYEVLVAAWQERQDVKGLQSRMGNLKRLVAELEAELRRAATDLYTTEGTKQPHPAVKIRLLSKLEYPKEAAFNWCGRFLPKALKLDRRLFEKHARAVADTDPIPFIEIVQEPQVLIARDLGAYIEEPASDG